jgi:hypothetical protein
VLQSQPDKDTEANIFDKVDMRFPTYSDEVIEAMVEAMCSMHASARDREIYREALRGLVRLGQAEQLLSMQIDFNCLTRGPTLHH